MLTLVEIPGVPENVNLNLYRYSEVERLLTDKAFFIKREMESKLSQLEESA